MMLELRRDLKELDTVFDHSFVFDAHSPDRSTLITRYRGTDVRKSDAGWNVVAWQKSVYHFGDLNREVPVLAVVLLDEEGLVRGLSLDENCLGSQGRRCDFRQLQIGMNELLKGKPFADFNSLCPNAGVARCLHLFELLGGAAGFFSELRQRDLAEGIEQELVTITPNDDGLVAENTHIILDQESTTRYDLRYLQPPKRNDRDLTESIDATVVVSYNGDTAFTERLTAEQFQDVYAALNLMFGKSYQLEKKFFGFHSRRRVRFTNCTALAGLFLLTFSHESMLGAISRAIRIEKILHFIQTGEGRTGCIGFGG
jgi:hypothetical protein